MSGVAPRNGLDFDPFGYLGEELSAIAAGRQLTRWLNVRTGAPLLRRVRTVVDTGRRPMEYAEVHYRCRRFNLALTLRQDQL